MNIFGSGTAINKRDAGINDILVSDWKFRPHLRSDSGDEYYQLAFMENSNARRHNIQGGKYAVKIGTVLGSDNRWNKSIKPR
jgi:hypothetical protein